MLIRPINESDLNSLYDLAKSAGIGVTTLPVNRDLLAQRIQESVNSFEKKISPQDAYYFFALEDTDNDKIVGVSGVKARVGLDEVWYNYRVSNTVNASKELGLHVQTPTLYLSNDMTNYTEICTLFLHPEYRKNFNGQLLSKSRFLFLAEFRDKFSEKVFAEMRGYADEEGNSPFWEDLGRKFFNIQFKEADYLTGVGNKSFIAELMPKYPIYVPFFSKQAQEAIGQVHPQTKPAIAMLEREGFRYNNMIDIFDAGPLVEAPLVAIRAVRKSVKRKVVCSENIGQLTDIDDRPFMVSNRKFKKYRVALVASNQVTTDGVILSKKLMDKLGVKEGDSVRAVRLRSGSIVKQNSVK